MTQSEELVMEQRALLASWRTLLRTSFAIYHALEPAARPPELMAGITQARSGIAKAKEYLRVAGIDVHDNPDEITTADPETVGHTLKLLSINRRNLGLLFKQRRSQIPGVPPPQMVNQVQAAQREVAELKRRLREWQVEVDDLPEDDASVE